MLAGRSIVRRFCRTYMAHGPCLFCASLHFAPNSPLQGGDCPTRCPSLWRPPPRACRDGLSHRGFLLSYRLRRYPNQSAPVRRGLPRTSQMALFAHRHHSRHWFQRHHYPVSPLSRFLTPARDVGSLAHLVCESGVQGLAVFVVESSRL